MQAKSIKRLAACLTLAFLGAGAQAQTNAVKNYPERPIRFLVGFSAGGSTDILARMIEPGLSKELGQPIVVENRPGVGGVLAADLLVRAPADGYTIMACTNGMLTTYQFLNAQPKFDAAKDILPVAQIATIPYILLVPPSLPAKDVAAFVDLAKKKPGGLNYGSSGIGSGGHLAGELFSSQFKLNTTHVPYKGSSQAMVDLVAGQLDFSFDQEATTAPYISGGKLKVLGVAFANRLPNMPDVPTLNELGFPFEANAWTGICLPAGTDPAIAERISKALNKVMADTGIHAKFAQQGLIPVQGTRQEFETLIENDRKKWGDLIKKLGIRLD